MIGFIRIPTFLLRQGITEELSRRLFYAFTIEPAVKIRLPTD